MTVKLLSDSKMESVMSGHQIEETSEQYIPQVECYKQEWDWVSSLSHELRTPLNVILSTIQLIQHGFDCSGNSAYRLVKNKHLNSIRQNSLRILKIVNNLVDINRFDAGVFKVNAKNENIVAIVKDISNSVAEYAKMKKIHITFISNVKKHIIACDSFLIERILLNLLSNAVKFTPNGGKIDISLKTTQERTAISISDTGTGIPEEFKESIFNRYHQTDGKSALEKKGSGLGLYLVKKLLEQMSGDIELTSEVGKGSTFTFFLPNIILRGPGPSANEKGSVVHGNSRVEFMDIEFSDIYQSGGSRPS